MQKNSIKSNPILWKRLVENIKSKSAYGTAAGQWSARKAQAAVKEYKKKGGEYIGGSKSETALNKWIIEDWRPYGSKRRWAYNTASDLFVETAIAWWMVL